MLTTMQKRCEKSLSWKGGAEMKRRLLVAAVTAAVCFALFSWFHVSGTEIRYAKDISADCSVTVSGYGKEPTTGIGTGGLEIIR